MSDREEELKARVRETPLLERLEQCRKRVANMCAERRGPKMSIPVEHSDDDFFICTTLEDAREDVARLRGTLERIAKYGDNGICPYGCDTPHIAQAALTPQAGKGGGNG